MSNLAMLSDAEKMKTQQLQLCNDFFIYAKGAEDRSYIVFDKYLDLIQPKRIIMLDSRAKNETLSIEEIAKYNSIEDIAKQKGIDNIKTISLESSNVGKHLSNERLQSTSSVAIDISSMNFWELSDLLYFLLKVICVQRIDVFYTEPDIYHYENDDISQYNYKELEVSVNYPKSYYSTRTINEEILVSIIGFQKGVNRMMKDIIEVSNYYSVNGFPSFYPKAKDISKANNVDYLTEINPANRFSAEATNPFITFNVLSEISKSADGAFMNICPLGSKPMAVGACLYALKFPCTTRIVYPYKETITTKSDGVGKTFCYSIRQSFLS